MKKKRIPRKTFHTEEILRFMALLESNEMKMSATARELVIDRTTLYKWKDKYWDAYLQQKNEIKEQSRDIASLKLYTVQSFKELQDIFTQALRLALNQAITILSNPENLKKLSNKDLTEFIKVIAPYAAEKVGLSGSEVPLTPFQNHTTYIQNIIQQLNVKGIKNMRNANKQDQV
jgi:transposase-like protein